MKRIVPAILAAAIPAMILVLATGGKLSDSEPDPAGTASPKTAETAAVRGADEFREPVRPVPESEPPDMDSVPSDPMEADEESFGTEEEEKARRLRLAEAGKPVSKLRGDLARVSREKLTTYLPSIWPVHGVISSPFGPRRSPFTGRPRFHSGIDIAAPLGTPVRAPANGVVIFTGKDGGYGLSVELVHLGGIVTRHAHLSKIVAKQGEIVRKGETLGLVGSTGASTGPHLHYEVIVEGAATNPMRHILER